MLDEIFAEYSDRTAQKELYQRTVKAISQKELARLTDYYEHHKENRRVLEFAEGHNMVFFDAKDGSVHYFAQMQRSVQDQIDSVVIHKNRQYQWLLAEAYEAFEDYLEDLYACIGFSDNNLWPMSDFGSVSIKELPGKDLQWYKERVGEKRRKPLSILNQLRKVFPEICRIEEQNIFGINLRLSIITVEMLRHIIVHNGGIVDDKDAFIEGILKKAGLYKSDDESARSVRFVNAFFASGQYSRNITLLEIEQHRDIPNDGSYVDRFDLLLGHLMSYAHYINEVAKTHMKPR